MINIVLNDTDSSEVFKQLAYQQPGVAFAPKLVHTGSFTIESYLAFGKIDFDFESIANLYEQFMLPKKTTRLFDLEYEPLLIVHYWSHLLVNSKHTILDIPEHDFSDEFIFGLKHLISFYNQREITIITKNKRVIEILKQLDGTQKKLLPTYEFKMTKLEIANMFIGEKIIVLASLIFALVIIIFALMVDSHIAGDYVDYLKAPDNVVFVDNHPDDCSFNQIAYKLPEDQCADSEPITYSMLTDLVQLDSVNLIAFDDEYNKAKLDQALVDNPTATASVPNLDYTISDKVSTIPCLNEADTAEAIICTDYNPDNSLISIATSEDTETLERNIKHNDDVTPELIILDTTDEVFISNLIANMYPSINVYTNQSTETYIRKANFKLLGNAIISGTLVSLISVFILNLLISQLKLYMRGHKYMLSYLTKKPVKIHRIFYLSQMGYYLTLFTIGSVIAANLTHSLTAFLVCSYLGILNIILWLVFSDINGVEFRIENKKVYNRILNKQPKQK